MYALSQDAVTDVAVPAVGVFGVTIVMFVASMQKLIAMFVHV